MNKQYIVKNCPGLRGWVCNEKFVTTDEMISCSDRNDCIIKQLLETCKKEVDLRKVASLDDNFHKYVLDIFKIEE